MKRVAVIVAVGSLMGLGFACDGSAQTQPSAPAYRSPNQSQTAVPRETFRHTEGVLDSSSMIGARVKNAQGKDIGEIDQLLIDPKAGKVTHAVIGVGGLLGIGEKHVAVPWSEIRMVADMTGRADRPVVTMEQVTLESAPRYDRRATSIDRDRSAPSASPRGTVDRPATTDRPPSYPSGTNR